MVNIVSIVSIGIIPLIIGIILIHGYIKGVEIYDCFVEGAREGLKSAIRIIPSLIAIFIAIGLFRKSGSMEMLIKLISPLGRLAGIPQETMPLFVIRPISGSASLAILRDIITTHGPDSFIGRVSSTMMGSAETIIYTIAVYFGAVGIKDSRHTLGAALVSHLAGTIASVVVCSMVFK